MNQTKSKSHGISQCAKYALLSVHVSAISVAMVLSASIFGAGYHLLGFVITCTRKSENVLILFDDAMSILACGRNQTAKKTRVYFWIGCAAPIIRREKTSASAEYKKKCITFSCHGFEKESNWPGRKDKKWTKKTTHTIEYMLFVPHRNSFVRGLPSPVRPGRLSANTTIATNTKRIISRSVVGRTYPNEKKNKKKILSKYGCTFCACALKIPQRDINIETHEHKCTPLWCTRKEVDEHRRRRKTHTTNKQRKKNLIKHVLLDVDNWTFWKY